jgi:hypothetical protein
VQDLKESQCVDTEAMQMPNRIEEPVKEPTPEQ